jgi:quinol monooxygenase YgiN
MAVHHPTNDRLEPDVTRYVQIMEIKTSRIDEVRALMDRMHEENRGTLRSTRALLTADRDRPGHYLSIIEFRSYEEAMEQSNDPVVGGFAQKLGALLDGPPTFYNLDVAQEFEE